MKVLVFGRSGQLASSLLANASSWDVTALGRDEADLLDPRRAGLEIAQRRPDLVVNAAAYTAVDLAEREPDLALQMNAEAPRCLAEAAAAVDIPFVHVSTDYVFDGAGQLAHRPTDPTAPLNVYGRTKREGELAVAAAGGRFSILRTSWVFSTYGHNFVKTMLRLGKDRAEIKVVSDQVGGPTEASDLAAAVLAVGARLRDGAPSGIHHFAGAPDVSWADFARAVFREAGLATRVVDQSAAEYPTVARRPLNSRLDCSSLLDVYGIGRPDWHEGLRRVVAQLGENG
ncbi:dTDP-4-dehydrorhamnose reductase [Devosia enhydra]|uniref:dTDP-4-dehydrorhamnose reductase n=1 Tax=Devosia enhydra TaxID=665118 RepID=A0A1K2HSA3_9HYPH|nr:dTDP-4-dehydrorhamnose reductase [Devosia enhydra]SFZ80666.1 dTDP-4-dehydrorhamnose reductase [Devosia enhydra]